MKILYILHATVMGGATISFINMINGLKAKGVRPIIIIPKECNDSDFMEFVKNNNIETHKIRIATSYYIPSNSNKWIEYTRFSVINYRINHLKNIIVSPNYF